MDMQRHFERPEIIANPIYRILLNTSEGKSVIKYYRTHGFLRKPNRCLASRLIVDPEKDRQLEAIFREPGVNLVEHFKISKEQFTTWSEDIEKLFPGESKFLYYTPYSSYNVNVPQPDGSIEIKKKKVNTKGILYEHTEYLRGKLRNQGLLQRPEIEEIVQQPQHQVNDEEQHAIEWLATHIGPSDAVILSWDTSYPARQVLLRDGCSIHEYFQRFPVLKGVLGAELLSNDFQRIYPQAEAEFFDRWESVKIIIKTALANCAKLKGNDLAYFRSLPALAREKEDSILLHLLAYIISPPRSRNGTAKTTIPEKQESLIIRAETAADIDRALDRQRQICIDTRTTLQPIPVIVGQVVNPEAFYVYINDSLENPTIYQARSILHAITLTFKVIFTLNCSYTARAESIWIFLQKAIFGINLPTDKCSRETEALTARISQLIARNNENINPN